MERIHIYIICLQVHVTLKWIVVKNKTVLKAFPSKKFF